MKFCWSKIKIVYLCSRFSCPIFCNFLEGGAKITTFFHLCKGQGIFPFPCRKKIHFAASVLSQKVAFLIGTYPHTAPAACVFFRIVSLLRSHTAPAAWCGGSRMACRWYALFITQEIILVNLTAIRFDKRTILRRKFNLFVMLFLTHYIPYNHILVVQTVAKARILMCPPTEMWKVGIDLQPFACLRLYPLNKG